MVIASLEPSAAIIRDPLVVSPDTTLIAAISQMNNRRACSAEPGEFISNSLGEMDGLLNGFDDETRSSCVVVVEGERVVGILTVGDALNLSAQQQPLTRLVISQVMSQPVVTLRESALTDVSVVVKLLKQEKIRHLPILDEQDRLAGLVTLERLHWVAITHQQLRSRHQESVIAEIALRIRQHIGTEDISNAIVQEVREFLAADRVIIYRFNPDMSGAIVAEAILPPWSPCLHTQVTEPCFNDTLHEAYQNGKVFAAADIYKANLTECHLQLLEQFQVRANLVVPIVRPNDGTFPLWGLLIAHQCSGPRQWDGMHIRLLQQLSVQLAIALQQADLYQSHQKLNVSLEQKVKKLQALAQRERLIANMAAQIRSSLNLQEILETTTREMRALLQCDRVIIYQLRSDLSGTVVAESLKGAGRSVLHREVYDPCVSPEWVESYRQGRIRAVNDIYQEAMTRCHQELLIGFDIRAKLMAPIVVEERLWGLIITSHRDTPRVWQTDEIEHVQQLSIQISIAIQQAMAYEKAQNELAERQKIEAHLRTSKQRYASLAAAAPVGIFWTDAAGHCLYVNDCWCQITGLLPEAAAGDGWQQGLHPNDRDWVSADWDNSVQQAQPLRLEFRFQRPDGDVRWVYGQSVAERDANGRVLGYVGVIADISDRKQAEMQLQQSNQKLAAATRLKDEFLANMSHELRTPLNAILGMTEGLQDGVFGEINAEESKALQIIEYSGAHLLELINDILDVAKIESGQIELERQYTTVASLCQSSLAFIRQQAQKNHIQLKMMLSSNLPNVSLDERRIRQVLINLLNNAVKFTPEGGRVTLAASCHPLPEDSDADATPQVLLQIAVTDTGIGIAPDQISKLFQPFVQIDSALNRQYAGTGLGLTLVKRIVELHGGQVEVSSEVGVGSRFMVNLPCAVSAPLLAEPRPQPEFNLDPSQPEPTTYPLILLAEDNEANMRTMTSYLSAKGYCVLLAKTGQGAIALARAKNPSLILMDIQMPGVDGLEAIRQIRGDRNLANVPIIALTALAMDGDRERCLAAGANDYLSKPIKLKQLVITIQQLLAPQDSNLKRDNPLEKESRNQSESSSWLTSDS